MKNKANNQLTITLPKQLMESMNWKAGDTVKFDVLGKDRLDLRKI